MQLRLQRHTSKAQHLGLLSHNVCRDSCKDFSANTAQEEGDRRTCAKIVQGGVMVLMHSLACYKSNVDNRYPLSG